MYKIMVEKTNGKMVVPWYDDVAKVRSDSKDYMDGYMDALCRNFRAVNWKYAVVEEGKNVDDLKAVAFPKPKDKKK